MFEKAQDLIYKVLENFKRRCCIFKFKEFFDFIPNIGLMFLGASLVGRFIKDDFSIIISAELFIFGLILVIIGFLKLKGEGEDNE